MGQTRIQVYSISPTYKTMDYTKKALDIIQNKGVSEWLKVRDAVNIEAINAGYCVDIQGCCEEDRCDCVDYRGLTLEEANAKLEQRIKDRKESNKQNFNS